MSNKRFILQHKHNGMYFKETIPNRKTGHPLAEGLMTPYPELAAVTPTAIQAEILKSYVLSPVMWRVKEI